MSGTHERLAARRRGDGGFTLIELLIILTILGILAAVVVVMLMGVTPRTVRSACDANAKTVNAAATAYLVEHPELQQVTEAELTAQNTGTLQSWPSTAADNYQIVIAGDTDAPPVGTNDAANVPISANDVLVEVGGLYYDASKSLPGACDAA